MAGVGERRNIELEAAFSVAQAAGGRTRAMAEFTKDGSVYGDLIEVLLEKKSSRLAPLGD